MVNLATNTHLVPLKELPFGEIARIRNSVINQVVALASSELRIKEEDLVVRDIQPYTDLGWDYSAATNGTAENWVHSATGTTIGYHSFTGATTMADQRYTAIFGIRDTRFNLGGTQLATVQVSYYKNYLPASMVKFEVGGAVKAIWDITSLGAYSTDMSAFSYSPVLIPQNVAFNIYYYVKQFGDTVGTPASDADMYLQLVGVVVEPRGKVVSP